MDVRKGKANIRYATRGLHVACPRPRTSVRVSRPTAQAERPRWLSYPHYLPAIWQDMTVGGDETVSALVWWVIPIAITAIAIAVVSLRSRIADPRTDPMADRARLREAMERPIPRTHRGPAAK